MPIRLPWQARCWPSCGLCMTWCAKPPGGPPQSPLRLRSPHRLPNKTSKKIAKQPVRTSASAIFSLVFCLHQRAAGVAAWNLLGVCQGAVEPPGAASTEPHTTPREGATMLSRTADHLFWMARYTERAENTARMLDVNYQSALLPQSTEVAKQGWQGLLSISELLPAYTAQHGEVTPAKVLDFMVKDPSNPSSILACLQAARENARAVRGALNTEAWEIQNQTWLEVNRLIASGALEQDPARFFEWVKFRSHLSRGVTVGTMLQDDAVQSDFMGAATAQDQDYDFYHWSAILLSVSGFETYRKVYRDVITPERVAELLILRADMPRSLHACIKEVLGNLDMLGSGQSAETQRHAGRLLAHLKFARIDEILTHGLHAYLTQFLERVNDLGARISRDFLVPAAV